MMDVTSELAWDYTGDESSPLLQRSVSPLFRWDDSCRLSRPQTQYIIHSLTESVQILTAASRHPLTNDNVPRVEPGMGGAISTGRCDRLFCVLSAVHKKLWPYFALITLGLQIIAVISESLWDMVELSHQSNLTPPLTPPLDSTINPSDSPHTTQEPLGRALHKPVIQAFISPLCCLLLLCIYVDVMYKLRRGRVTLRSWVSSFSSSLIVFSGVYASFIRFYPGCFQHVLSSQSVFLLDGAIASQIYIVSFLSALHYSISVFTLYQSMTWVAVSWFAITVLTIQMLIGYAHFVILVSNLWRFIPHIPSSNPSPLNHLLPTEDATSLRRFPGEYDTDSLLFYQQPTQLHSNNPSAVAVGVYGATSGRATDGVGAATVVTEAAEDVVIQNRRLKQVTEDDMLLSNSI